MIPKSVLDMINDVTKKAYILTALEYIKEECISHADDKADEDEIPDVCTKCPFFDGVFCFFNAGFDGRIPEEWDLDSLQEKLGKENKL